MNRINIKFLILIVFCLIFLIQTSCEYDVKQPLWYENVEEPPIPEISQLNPDEKAPAGINYITINGNNFASEVAQNKVYFNKIKAEVVSASSSAITVRRPNISGETTVKVVSYDALRVVKYTPYQVDSVWKYYGNILGNDEIASITIDKSDNIYVCFLDSREIVKITPNGDHESIVASTRRVTDAQIAPDGNLILLSNYRYIYKVNLETKEESQWVNAISKVSYGDFDANGNLYTAGDRTDLIVITPDLSVNKVGFYASDNIMAVRIYDNYVYVSVEAANPDEQTPEIAIWRHRILDANGALAEKELVLDWSEISEYATSTINTFTFDKDGIMYIGTNNANPILMYNPQDKSSDMLYKGILPITSQKLIWGNGNHLYMLLGGEEWDIVQIDMAKAGAPYFGRK